MTFAIFVVHEFVLFYESGVLINRVSNKNYFADIHNGDTVLTIIIIINMLSQCMRDFVTVFIARIIKL